MLLIHKAFSVTILLFLIVAIVLTSVSLYMLFPKLDLPAWKGAVPVLNYMEIAEKVGRSKWYGALSAVPILNIFIVTGLSVALIRSFDKFSLGDAAKAVIYAPLSFFQLAKDEKAQFVGPIISRESDYQKQIIDARKSKQDRKLNKLMKNNPYRKSVAREWFESIVFAVFAAAFIRMFFIEAYVIPTPSMEGSLLVGDYLFVSKASYGIRTPQTVAMIPLLHNRIPVIGSESYLKKPSLPYYRFPALSNIDRNNPIVFNWPVGDSVYITKLRSYSVSQIQREPRYLQQDPELKQLVDKKAYKVRPMDKKDHYVKRAVAVAGDTLEIRDTKIYINGTLEPQSNTVQFLYQIAGDLNSINPKKREEWGLTRDNGDGRSVFYLSDEVAESIKANNSNLVVQRRSNSSDPTKMFPHDPTIVDGWTVDDFGPIYIPKKGATTQLSISNIALYKKLIRDYEHNKLEIKGDQIFINDELATSYTFKQDYFWAMGDNRHNSEDSRMWGFVPHDHMVGKPLVIWFSSKNGIRWNRIFKSASDI